MLRLSNEQDKDLIAKKSTTTLGYNEQSESQRSHDQFSLKTFSSENEGVLLAFLHRVQQWLQTNRARVINFFTMFDTDSDNHLSGEEFADAMRMIGAPATADEIEKLIQIIDSGDRKMNVLDFDRLVRDYQRRLLIRKSTIGLGLMDTPEDNPVLQFSPSRSSVKCSQCGIGIAEPPAEKDARYISLRAVLAPFRDIKKHPAHAQLKVTESTSIHGLKQLIRDHLGYAVQTVTVFKEASCSQSSVLSPSWCLAHCGLTGGLEIEPTSAVLFYDYVPLLDDCPILMNDSYIT